MMMIIMEDDNDDDNGKGQRTKRSQTYQRDSSHSRHWLKGQENILTSLSSSSLLCTVLIFLCFCLVVFQCFKILLFVPCCTSIFQNVFFCIVAFQYFKTALLLPCCILIFQNIFILPCCILIFQNILVFALLYFNISKYLCFALLYFNISKYLCFALLYFNISKRCRELGLVTRSASLAPELHPLWWSALSCRRSLPKIDYKVFHQKTSF